MKVYVAYDRLEERLIGIFSSSGRRMNAVVEYFNYMKDDPFELALAAENDIVYSEHTLDKGAK